MIIRNFEQANKVLAKYAPKDLVSAYKLDRMKKLMSLIGNPQDKIKVIHVGGTSGKTSTVYFIAALLSSRNKKVGFSVSPHVSEVNERIQLDGKSLVEAAFCKILGEFLDLISPFNLNPTYFEILIALAYYEFARQKVDYAVMEVGLGGLLDGTNVVSSENKICVITDIGLDHINILGDNLTDITRQKAGIIHKGNEVFAYIQNENVNKVLTDTCNDIGAKLHILKNDTFLEGTDFLPLFQQRNISLAKEVADYALRRDYSESLSQKDIIRAASIVIPARMETFDKKGKVIICDGAHNYQKIEALGSSIKNKYPGKDIAALVSFADGRGYRLEGSLGALREISGKVIFTSFAKSQDLKHTSVDPKVLQQMSKTFNFELAEAVPDPHKAFEKLMARPEQILLITGSFFMMNDLRPLVQKL